MRVLHANPWLTFVPALASLLAGLLAGSRPGLGLVAFATGCLALAAYAWVTHQAAEEGEPLPGLFHGVLLASALGLGLPGLAQRPLPPAASQSKIAEPSGAQPSDKPRLELPAPAMTQGSMPEVIATAKVESLAFRAASLAREINVGAAGGPNGEKGSDWIIEGVIHDMGTYPNPYTEQLTQVTRAERPAHPGEIALWPGIRPATRYRPEAKTLEIRMLILRNGAPEVRERTLEVLE